MDQCVEIMNMRTREKVFKEDIFDQSSDSNREFGVRIEFR